MKMKITRFAGLSAALLAFIPCAQAQSVLLDYRFNDSGTMVTNGGALLGATLQFRDSDGVAADLHSTGLKGVSGLPGDEAFDNSAATKMGSGGTGGAAKSPGNVSLGNVASFTMTGWFYATGDSFRGGARILDVSPMINLTAGGNGVMSLYVNNTGTAVSTPENATYKSTNGWVFFAVSYDSTAASDNVRFYVGTKATDVVEVGGAQTYAQGAISFSSTAGLTLGNNNGGYIRPFDGYLDNIRLYGSETGNSGVLSLDQLKAVRAFDINPTSIPEASTFSYVAAIALAGLALRNARRRR